MQRDTPQPPLRIGLTGGIASGKSTVANLFAELGASIVDTDVIAREVVAPGQPALQQIRERFGDDVIDEQGRLDRNGLRRIVFADDGARHDLEAILHPRIREETLRQADKATGPYQLIVVPLLVESPMRHNMDRILVVDVPESLQMQRLLDRDGGDEDQARRIISAQASREERFAIADDIVRNDRSLDDTRQQVQSLHERYLAAAAG